MRLKFLLRPGWAGLILLVAVFAVVCFTLLAPWQFSRDEQAQTRNASIEASYSAVPQPLNAVLPAGKAPSESNEWTKVSATGHYLPEAETLGWLRTVQGEPAIEVLTPFQLDSGEAVLINRGFVRPVGGVHAPGFAAAPTGPVTLTARVRMDETDSKNRALFERDGHKWVYAIDAKTVAAGTGVPLSPGYFALTPDQPGVLDPLPLPQLESGPYFSYALQWITFGIMAPLAVGYLIYSELHPPEPARSRSTQEPRAESARRPRKMSVAQAIAEDERREREAGES